MTRWTFRKIPSKKSRRATISPNQVKHVEPSSWIGELPPIGPDLIYWIDDYTRQLKLAARQGDIESVDEILEIMHYPCTLPHHPENHELTASVCETMAAKIRSVKEYAATDDIADKMTVAANNLDGTLAKEWREYEYTEELNTQNATKLALRGKLRAGSEIYGNLLLGDGKIKRLPDDLVVHGSVMLGYSPIESLPNNLRILGTLDISHTQIESLPENLYVDRNLDLGGSRITKMSEDIHVGGIIIMPNGAVIKGVEEARKYFRDKHPEIGEWVHRGPKESAILGISRTYPGVDIGSIKVTQIYYSDRGGWRWAPPELQNFDSYLLAPSQDQGEMVQVSFDEVIGNDGGMPVIAHREPDFSVRNELLNNLLD